MDFAPDFVKLAESFGALGLRATKPEEVETVLKEGLSSSNTVIMDFVVEQEEGGLSDGAFRSTDNRYATGLGR